MFSNNIFEMIRLHQGLMFCHDLSKFIMSNKISLMVISILFSYFFLKRTVGLIGLSKNALIVDSRSPLHRFMKIIIILWASFAILGYTEKIRVADLKGVDWSDNKVVKQKIKDDKNIQFDTYEIPVVLSKTLKFITYIEKYLLVNTKNIMKNRDKGSFFGEASFKPILTAGYSLFKDRSISARLGIYYKDCVEKMLIQSNSATLDDILSARTMDSIDVSKFDSIATRTGTPCRIEQEKINKLVMKFTKTGNKKYMKSVENSFGFSNSSQKKNFIVSQFLAESFKEKMNKSGLADQAKTKGATGFLASFASIFTCNGWGLGGACKASELALVYNQLIRVAPIAKGSILAFLISFFPLVIFIMMWKESFAPIKWWLAGIASLSAITVIWEITYRICFWSAFEVNSMDKFSKFADGLSVYAARSVMSDIEYSYLVFFAIQILSLFGVAILLCIPVFGSILNKGENERMPESIKSGVSQTSRFTVGGF